LVRNETHARHAASPGRRSRRLGPLRYVARWYRRPEDDLAWATKPPAGGAHAIIASVDADILLTGSGVGRGLGPAALKARAADIGRDPTVPLI
jgi:hypothetical protein